MWCTSRRTQNEMASVSIWDVLAFDVKRLHRICKRVPRMPRTCRYPTRPSKRTKYDSKTMAFQGMGTRFDWRNSPQVIQRSKIHFGRNRLFHKMGRSNTTGKCRSRDCDRVYSETYYI